MKLLAEQIAAAMGAHGCWKLQLKEAVARGMLHCKSDDIARDDMCTFGKWLGDLTAEPEIAGSPEFKNVVLAHRRFHKAAGQIAKCLEARKAEHARTLVNSAEFQLISDQLGKAMIDWRKSLQ